MFRLHPVGTTVIEHVAKPDRRIIRPLLATPYRDVDPDHASPPRDPFEVDPRSADRPWATRPPGDATGTEERHRPSRVHAAVPWSWRPKLRYRLAPPSGRHGRRGQEPDRDERGQSDPTRARSGTRLPTPARRPFRHSECGGRARKQACRSSMARPVRSPWRLAVLGTTTSTHCSRPDPHQARRALSFSTVSPSWNASFISPTATTEDVSVPRAFYLDDLEIFWNEIEKAAADAPLGALSQRRSEAQCWRCPRSRGRRPPRRQPRTSCAP